MDNTSNIEQDTIILGIYDFLSIAYTPGHIMTFSFDDLQNIRRKVNQLNSFEHNGKQYFFEFDNVRRMLHELRIERRNMNFYTSYSNMYYMDIHKKDIERIYEMCDDYSGEDIYNCIKDICDEYITQIPNEMYLSICKDFSRTPGPALKREGPHSAEEFRENILYPKLQKAIDSNKLLVIDMDGTAGFGGGFLEEAFGGLMTKNSMEASDVINHIYLNSSEDIDYAYEVVSIINYYITENENYKVTIMDSHNFLVTILSTKPTDEYWEDLRKYLHYLQCTNANVYFDFLYRNGFSRRFFQTKLNGWVLPDNTLTPYQPSKYCLEIADNFFASHPEWIDTSVLTSNQKEEYKNHLYNER